MYIRPLLFGSSAQLGLSPPEEYTFVVWVLPVGVYHGVHSVPALILEDFDRAAPHGTGSAKVGGNYAPVLRFSERARADGFGITLHLDSRTRTEIDEFSTSAFLGVKKEGEKTTIVVPDSKNVIESVTADSVCDIARSFGWTVEKRAVSPVCISLPPISCALHNPPSPIPSVHPSPAHLLTTSTDQLRRAINIQRSLRSRHSRSPRPHQIHHDEIPQRHFHLPRLGRTRSHLSQASRQPKGHPDWTL